MYNVMQYMHVYLHIHHVHMIMCVLCTTSIASSTFVKECIDSAFDKANDYASRFEPYREFYQSNEELDIEKMEEEDHGRYSTMGGCMYSMFCVLYVYTKA